MDLYVPSPLSLFNCLPGKVCNIRARLNTGPPAGCNCLSTNAVENDEDNIHYLEVLLGSECCVICSPSIEGIIGFINLGVSGALRQLYEIEGTRLEISLSHSEWKSLTRRNSIKVWETNVDITIFGTRENALVVGDCLSSQALFLQDPKVSYDLRYENPHRFSCTDDSQDSDSESSEVGGNGTLSINELVPTSAKISNKRLQHILDNLHEHDYLQQVQPDEHLIIPLFAYVLKFL